VLNANPRTDLLRASFHTTAKHLLTSPAVPNKTTSACFGRTRRWTGSPQTSELTKALEACIKVPKIAGKQASCVATKIISAGAGTVVVVKKQPVAASYVV
jgi:hypothetical protein